MSIHIYLASASPRRKELLAQLPVEFDQFATDIDETHHHGESAEQFVIRLAEEKAKAGVRLAERNSPVLGSDTVVVLNDTILGKPRDHEDAKNTLMSLSGKTHRVLTAIAFANKNKVKSALVSTDVSFKLLTMGEIKQYIATGEPFDKAGSYGIQGQAGRFVTNINGSYFAVMGLPLYETAELLHLFLEENS